jgi:hypothetical protein
MTTAIAESEATEKASLWEDFVDIYLAPSAVFERRRDGRYGPALVVLTLMITALTYAFFSVLSTAFEADIARGMAEAGEGAQMPEMMIALTRNFAIFGSLVMVPIGAFLTGLLLWLIGRAFGGDLDFVLGTTIATFATFPRVLATLAGTIQGMLFEPDSMTGVSTGPARFMDPDTTHQALMALLARFDIFIIWSVILTAIGLRIIGGMKGSRAVAAAVIVWLIASIPVAIGAVMAS